MKKEKQLMKFAENNADWECVCSIHSLTFVVSPENWNGRRKAMVMT